MRNLTTLLLFFMSLAAFSQGNNPYKGLGEEAEKLGSEILTLSQGRYNEFHDNDTIVRIGAALYNVYTQKIVGFVVEEGHSEATMKPEVVSMWLSVDPLARKFPELTPYNFVEGNPVMLIDPDGLSAICPSCPEGKEFEVFRQSEFTFSYDEKNQTIQRVSTEKINLDKVKDPLLETAVFMNEVDRGNYTGDKISDHFETDVTNSFGQIQKSLKESGASIDITVQMDGDHRISETFDYRSRNYPNVSDPKYKGYTFIGLNSLKYSNKASSSGPTQFYLIKMDFSHNDKGKEQWRKTLHQIFE